MISETSLTGRTILVVEDDFFISEEMVSVFEKHGAIIVGPVATIEQACELIGEPRKSTGRFWM